MNNHVKRNLIRRLERLIEIEKKCKRHSLRRTEAKRIVKRINQENENISEFEDTKSKYFKGFSSMRN